MKISIKRAVINFVWAYLLVTVLAYSLSMLAGIIFKLPSYIDLGVSMFEDPAFVMTVPYHLLINLAIWVSFGYLYFRKKGNQECFLKEAFHLGFFWLGAAMIVDFIGFVLIKSPISLTIHQFYFEYQPWISITYLIVFISPFISYCIVNRKKFSPSPMDH